MNIKSFIIVLLSVLSLKAFSAEIVFCNSCTQLTEFKNYAKGVHGNGHGSGTYQVINYITEEIWDVYIESIHEPEVGLYLKIAHATAASNKDLQDFIIVKELLDNREILVTIPSPLPSGPGFAGNMLAQINGSISSNPQMIQLATRNMFAQAIKAAFGKTAIAVVVFSNGDVAKFAINNPSGGSLCCTYIQGTARDIEGNVIANSGGGAGGSPAGSGDYVTPIAGAVIELRIAIGTKTLSCKKIPTGVECKWV